MTDTVDHSKRQWLIAATSAASGVAAAGAGTPFVLSLMPSERAKAAGAPVEVDISKIAPGTMISVEWQGKPVWIVRRTQQMLDRWANFPFQRLQSDLANLIARTPAGVRLPSEPDLAKQLGVSRATLREAMRTFETQGLIRRRQGAGTFVVGRVPVIDSGLEVLESLDKMARRMNLVVSFSDLHIDRVYADQDSANGLGIPLASRLTRIRRVIRTDGGPVAYLIDTLPEEVLKL